MMKTRKTSIDSLSSWSATKDEKPKNLLLIDLRPSFDFQRLNSYSTNDSGATPRYESQRNLKKRPKSSAWSTDSTPTSKKKIFTPAEVLQEYPESLTEYEKVEILSFPQIFYFGKDIQKFPDSFDDEDGFYRGQTEDHLVYQYEILSILGKGEFSEVFDCLDHKTSKRFAIKILRSGELYRNSGEEECKILETIRKSKETHGNINLEVEHFEFRGHLCIVFEKLEQSLFDFQQNKPLPVPFVGHIIKQLLQALNCIHGLNLIHCDVKPDNIMFMDVQKSKIGLIDFGSACEFSRKTSDYIQSRPYRAPEIVIDIDYSTKIDMWSVGCLTLELVTGVQVFECDSETELFKKYIEVCGLPDRQFIAKGRRCTLFMDRLGRFKVKATPKLQEIEKILKGADKQLVDFVRQLLRWKPEERMSARSALLHNWIRSFP